MAPRLPLLLLALAATCPHALGKVIKVLDPNDGSGFNACPGSTCNLREAWRTAGLNDTILLEVDPIMDSHLGPLSYPAWDAATTNGTVTIMGPSNGGAVVTGSNRFLAMDSFPYGINAGVFVSLIIKNIEFTGFRYSPPTDSAAHPGLIFCISTEELCVQTSNRNAATESRLSAQGALPRPHSRGAAKSEVVGENQTPFGNFSTLRKRPILEISNCVFRNNSYFAPSGASKGALIYTRMLNGDIAHPIYITKSQFMNNSAQGEMSAGTVLLSEGEPHALMISESRFARNLQETGAYSGLIDSFMGPVIGSFGPISIYGTSFVGNSMGPCQSVITSGSTANNNYHTYVYDSSFIDNVGNGQPPNDVAATIDASWIVLHRVTAVLPTSVAPTFTQGSDDQYMHECAIRSDTGKAVKFNGFQMYNRNPTYTNWVNGTGSSFANCMEGAAWLPCRKGTSCTNLLNNDVVVGYNCA